VVRGFSSFARAFLVVVGEAVWVADDIVHRTRDG
jgi:hypothetical protein